MAGEDRKHAEKVRRRPCAGCEVQPAGTIQHPRTPFTGLSRRAHDHWGYPLCGSGTTGCHGSIGNPVMHGPFHGWTREERRAWEEQQGMRNRPEGCTCPNPWRAEGELAAFVYRERPRD